MIRISEKGKQRERRGTGTGAEYKPYIETREFNSCGTCSNPIDWITHRTVELFSQGEAEVWYVLRWQDEVEDILEQFPLELDCTVALAHKLGIRHPNNSRVRMTTDFLVILKNGERLAVSVKSSKRDLENDRTTEKLFLEMMYWKEKRVPFYLVFKDQMNHELVQNIRLVTEFYSPDSVFDDLSILKHLVATKQIEVDMSNGILDFSMLMQEYKGEIEQWKKWN